MQFCEFCEGLLIPKRNTDELFCRVCNKTFKTKNKADYKMQAKIEKDRVRSKTAIVETRAGTQSISEDERRAFEDYFTSGD